MKKLCTRLAILSLIVSAAACVGAEKSESPLSPAVAGPIPGVNISAPVVVAPPVDGRINTNAQPITLQVGNAATNGVRPLSYRFELATDAGFSNAVFAKDGVPNDASGRTSVTLPAPLSPERKYFWRARAEDGANTGPFGATSAFDVFTPVVFGAPVQVSPINGVSAGSQPLFVWANAAHTGPVGPISYYLEISASSSMAPVLWGYTISQSATSSQTEFGMPVPLAAGQHFWRVRAIDSGNNGPFSGVQSFVSGGSGGGGGGGNPGQPCGPPFPTTAIGILQCRRTQFPTNLSDSDHVAFLRGAAQDFNAGGIAGGPFGILVKTTGAQCNGYSCDILCSGQGAAQRQWDVLVGIPGSPVAFNEVAAPVTVRVCEIQ